MKWHASKKTGWQIGMLPDVNVNAIKAEPKRTQHQTGFARFVKPPAVDVLERSNIASNDALWWIRSLLNDDYRINSNEFARKTKLKSMLRKDANWLSGRKRQMLPNNKPFAVHCSLFAAIGCENVSVLWTISVRQWIEENLIVPPHKIHPFGD